MLLNCCVFLAIVHFSGASAPNGYLRVTPTGSVFTRSVGDNVVFTCFLRAEMMDVIINIQWFNQERIEILDKNPGRDNTPYIDKSQPLSNKLYITNIQPKHAGKYFCSAVVEGNRKEINVTLNLFANVVIFAPTPQNPIAGSPDALIQCRVSGNPIPTVYWRFRGQRIVTGERYHQDQFGLRVRNISRVDNGLYSCCAEVESSGYYDEETIDVIVDYKPNIIKGPGDKDGIQSQEYTLECLAEGHPDAKYEFFKDSNGAPVFSTERIQVDGDLGAIHFRPLHFEDAGDYKCHAFNRAGEDFKTGHLTVLVPPTIYNIKNTTAPEGRSATLVCLSYGDPPPDMTYRKEGNNEDYVMGPNENGRIVLSNPMSGQLNMVINDLVPEDMANYSCKAHNIAGSHDKNGSVTVLFSPRFRNDSATFVYNWAGKSRNLTCHVLAEPMPLIEWVRYDRVIQNNETFRTYIMAKDSNLQVTVREVDEGYIYGNFTCRAKNQYGTGTYNVEMRRAMLPGPPAEANVTDATPRTVTLSIALPRDEGGVKVFGYSVQHDHQIDEFFLGDEYLIEYLRAEFTYRFQIRARSEVGLGSPLELIFTTPSVTVPRKLVLTSDPEGMWTSEYMVTWEKPKTGGLPIREYDFKFRRIAVKPNTYEVDRPLSEWSRRVTQDSYETPMFYYLLGDLVHSSCYQMQVRAVNDAGWSEPSEAVFCTQKDPFGPPIPDELTNGSVSLICAWTTYACILVCFLSSLFCQI